MYQFWKHVLPRRWKTRAMVFWYDRLSRLDTGDDLLFLNHGFAPVDGEPHTLHVSADEEPDRYAIQLYHHVARRAEWRGMDALDVSSGRGGGTRWLLRHFAPHSMTGLEIAPAAVHFCRTHYSEPDLSFEVGDAQSMPFDSESFDIVINVESSLNYPDFAAFLSEVVRILRPGGLFLIGDYRRRRKVERVKDQFCGAGLEILEFEDISPQIVRGLQLSTIRKTQLIDKYVPSYLRSAVCQFARVSNGPDSDIELFANGSKQYFSAVLRKPQVPK